VSDD
jgi:hypothetical protein